MRSLLLAFIFLLPVVAWSQKPPIPFRDKETSKYGYKNGNTIVIQPKYYRVFPFAPVNSGSTEWLALIQQEQGGKLGYINQTGKEIVPMKFEMAYPFRRTGPSSAEWLAAVVMDGKAGFIDRQGKEIIPLKYDKVLGFSHTLAAVETGNKWGYIDSKGKVIIPLLFEEAKSFEWSGTKTMGLVKQYGKWGFINDKGTFIIPQQFEDARQFMFSLAPAKLNGKWGFIDEKGNVAIDYKYEYAEWFWSQDTAIAGNNGKVFLINRKGEQVTAPDSENSDAKRHLASARISYDSEKESQKQAKLPLQPIIIYRPPVVSPPASDKDKKAQEVWDLYKVYVKDANLIFGNFNTAWELFFTAGSDSASLKNNQKGRSGLWDAYRQSFLPFVNKSVKDLKALSLNKGDNLFADALGYYFEKHQTFSYHASNLIAFFSGGKLWPDFTTGMKLLQQSIADLQQAQKEVNKTATETIKRNKISNT